MRKDKIVIKKAKNGQYYFIVKAKNGRICGWGEMHPFKHGAKRAALNLRRIVQTADLVDETNE